MRCFGPAPPPFFIFFFIFFLNAGIVACLSGNVVSCGVFITCLLP